MVTVEVTRWPTPTRGPAGRIVEVLGDINDPGVDTEIILRKHGIPDEHSAEAIAEAKRIGAAVKEKDIAGRTDFRDRTVVTIDGEHARDFDDAISIEKLKNGHYWLGVHIADVAHYVHEGGPLDQEAYERGTSVYFPERAVHMFPRGAGDRAVQPQAARRSPRPVLPDGGHAARRRRALRDARRRDSQRRAHDLHGGQRDPDGQGSGDDRSSIASWCRCSS